MESSDFILRLRPGGKHIVEWNGKTAQIRFSREGELQVQALSLHGGVTAEDLCSFPLEGILEAARSGPMSALALTAVQGRPGPRGYSSEHFQAVARVYEQCHSTEEFMSTLHVSKSTAYAWIARARELGYLNTADGRDENQTASGETTGGASGLQRNGSD